MIATLLGLWTLMVLGAGTPTGAILRAGFIEAPARFLNRVGRGHVILTTLIVGGVAGVVWLIGNESVQLMAMAAPDVASFLMLVDAASLLDAGLAAILVATSVRIGGLRRVVATRQRRAPRPRTARARRARRVRPAANDDEDPGLAMAA